MRSSWKICEHYQDPIWKFKVCGQSEQFIDWLVLFQNWCLPGLYSFPLLFGITIDWVMKRSMENKTTGIKWHNNTIPEDLEVSDDIALLNHSYNDQHIKTTSLSERAGQVGLLINSTKTNILETLTSPNAITLNGNDIEKVNNFTYLGSYILNDGNITKRSSNKNCKSCCNLQKVEHHLEIK